jgi:hypothetical protein
MANWLHRRRAYRRLAGRSLRPDLSDTVVGALTLLSGVLVATVMPETLDKERGSASSKHTANIKM